MGILDSVNTTLAAPAENNALDASNSSLSSDDDAAARELVAAPLKPMTLKNGVQRIIQAEHDNVWRDKIKGYLMQGRVF